GWRLTSEAVVTRRVVVLHLVPHAADEADFVHDVRHARQIAADGRPHKARRHGPINTADFLRSIRLHVESIDVARAAVLMQENDRFGSRPSGPRLRRARQRTEKAEPADREKSAAIESWMKGWHENLVCKAIPQAKTCDYDLRENLVAPRALISAAF